MTETLKNFNTYLFKVTSVIPIIWISSLYLFLATCMIDLGSFPKPSLNDPKEIGINILYAFVGIGMFALFYGSILWLINFSIGAYFKKLPKKYLIIFLIGIIICLFQITFDPGQILTWYMD